MFLHVSTLSKALVGTMYLVFLASEGGGGTPIYDIIRYVSL